MRTARRESGSEVGPRAVPPASAGGRVAGTPFAVPFDLGPIVTATWRLFRQRWVIYLAICGTVLLLSVGTQLAQVRLIRGWTNPPRDRPPDFPIAFGTFFAGYLFTTWLSIGQRLALLGLIRSESTFLAEATRAGRYLLTSLLAGLTLVGLMATAVLSLVLPVLIVGKGLALRTSLLVPPLALAVLAAAAGSAALAIRLSQYPYLIIDRNVGVIESLLSSWRLTRSRGATLALVFALWLLINLAGVLCFLAGWLLTAPFASLMLAVAYESLAVESEARDV